MAGSTNLRNDSNHIVFYDGYCVLCSNSIDFIISKDYPNTFKFASIQSDFAHSVLPEIGYPISKLQNVSNIVYLRHSNIKIKSDAVLSILYDLGGVYRLSRLGYVVPSIIRNLIYDCLAKFRYKLFGRRTRCRVPTPQDMTKFLG